MRRKRRKLSISIEQIQPKNDGLHEAELITRGEIGSLQLNWINQKRVDETVRSLTDKIWECYKEFKLKKDRG